MKCDICNDEATFTINTVSGTREDGTFMPHQDVYLCNKHWLEQLK